jgi:hypothetical protein
LNLLVGFKSDLGSDCFYQSCALFPSLKATHPPIYVKLSPWAVVFYHSVRAAEKRALRATTVKVQVDVLLSGWGFFVFVEIILILGYCLVEVPVHFVAPSAAPNCLPVSFVDS